jgi:hypothetical protein
LHVREHPQAGRDRGDREQEARGGGSRRPSHAGLDFTVDGVTKTTDANGKACFDNLQFGDYTVHEVTPDGYNGEADKTVTSTMTRAARTTRSRLDPTSRDGAPAR